VASFHDFEMKSITGQTVDLSSYEGQLCLVVNVASQ
jgi:glutathione peroxidase-family protein